MNEIVNRVANSPLVTINLEEKYPTEKRILFDLKDYLFEELLLKEKDFRQALKEHDWEIYRDALVAIDCTTDAIVPAWAYMLVTSYLQPMAKKIVRGNLQKLDELIFSELIEKWDVTSFENKKVILKGCSHKPVPESAYVEMTNKLLPVVDSLMYGEACSTVPLYKSKK